MSKRKVNLFSGPLRKVNKSYDRLKIIRKAMIILSVIFFVGVIGGYFVQSKFTGDLLTSQYQRETYEKAITKAQERRADLVAIALRMRAIRKAMATDITYASRSAYLTQLLKETQSNPEFTSLSFSNKNDFETFLTFSSERDLMEFIRASEKDDFQKHFQTYSLGEFSITSASSSAVLPPLEFTGSLL